MRSLTHGPGSRLRSRRQFAAVQEHGRRVSTRYLTVLALPNTVGTDRLGVVASRRIGGAVIRNRAKRRVRELFRQRLDTPVDNARCLDLVVIARSELTAAPFAAVRAEFANALSRLRGPRSR